MGGVNVTIIGGGIVGLAVGAALSEKYGDIYILEKNWNVGLESSSHNSGVIHSGIHYPPGSLKAKLCVRGNSLIYGICEKNGIACRRTGKMTVSSWDDFSKLDELRRQGQSNGVKGMKILDSEEISEIEPLLKADFALFTPSSGIVDQDALINYFYSKFVNNGGMLITDSLVSKVTKRDGSYEVSGTRKGGKFSFNSKAVINSAGLYGDKIAEGVGIDVGSMGYKIRYCKGDYYRIEGRGPVSTLVYPLPGRDGLGIHLTPDISGTVRLGPNAYYVDKIDYSVETDVSVFIKDVGRYIPSIGKYTLVPDYAGIRPKLEDDGTGFRDFVIEECSELGYENFINLIGIESPGLTASPAIGEYVADLYSKSVA
ncbi:MAG: NAD(P)/FAD-dependent oxidoreductase [Thermoplasmatales archaeon]